MTLMQQWETAVSVTNTAMNSQGSAMRENEEYLNSLEARSNRLNNALTELAITMGDALLTDTIIMLTEAGINLANAFNSLVDNVGILPPLITALGATVLLLSKNFRTSFTALIQGTRNMKSAEL